MKIKINYNIIIFFITSILIFNKYFISCYFFPDEDFFFKILRYGEVDFLHYTLIVEKLSTFTLKTDWSNLYIVDGIIGFPIFSLIWHSIFFKFLSYYSFLILEFLFYFTNFFLLFKIFKEIFKNELSALLSIICLYFSLEFLEFINYFFDLNIFSVLKLPIYEFISNRFPRPLITSTYFFLIIYSLLKINKYRNFFLKKKYLYISSISLFFLLNSFFYLFISLSILLFFTFLIYHKNNLIFVLQNNFKPILICSIIIFSGFLVFFIQSAFTEDDYPIRIGLYIINFDEKILLIKHFFYKLFQPEIILLILISLFIKFFYIVDSKKRLNFDTFFYLFVLSLVAPFFFLILSDRIISLYHFWTVVKFTGFLYIFIALSNIITINLKIIYLRLLTNFFFILLISLNFYVNLNNEKNIDDQLIIDQSELKKFLIKADYINSNKLLNSNDHTVNHLWLSLSNKYFINTTGFVSSLSDDQIEKLIFNMYKLKEIDLDNFSKLLNNNENNSLDRNEFSSNFNYKYSVNSIRHAKPLKEEYSSFLVERIRNISPLIQWYTFVPNSEKKRLINKFQSYEIDEKYLPDFLILNKNNLEINQKINFYYDSEFSNINFDVFIKKDSLNK